MANTRAKVTKNIEIVNEIAEKFFPRLSFYHKCNKSLASFAPHALKGQKLLAQGNGHKQHALKGQKLLAQGMDTSSTPCFTLIEQALSAFFNVNYI